MPLKTLFLNPPSFENFDGGASSRWPATREIESYWYPVWLAYPAGMLEGSKLLDAPPHHVSADETIEIAKNFDFLVLFTSTVGWSGDHGLARAIKNELRESGMADAPRFGFCKRTGCANRKVERLLLRGFCPLCRGIVVAQTAHGITVAVDTKIDPAVLELTTEERRAKVQTAKQRNPSATVSELARLANLPRKTVHDILKNPIVKTTTKNTDEVAQFLKERADSAPQLQEEAKLYLKNRMKIDSDLVNQSSVNSRR